MKTLETFKIKNMTLPNRVVMAPMCMQAADDSGKVNDFHIAHYMSRAIGRVGLIILESTAVTRDGRIMEKDLGLWTDDQIPGMKRLVEGLHSRGSKAGIQLNHCGRKYMGDSMPETLAPSTIAYGEDKKIPRALTIEEIEKLVDAFKEAARRADEAGFDTIEIHAAHGYLIHEFLSPLSNQRTDQYGGSLENRLRFLQEVLKAVHTVWPQEKPIIIRVSGTEYVEGGYSPEELTEMINAVKNDIDLVHVTTAGNALADIDVFPGYQVKYSELIKNRCDIPTIAVGRVSQIEMIEEILGNQRADLVALGKVLLREPQFVINEALRKGIRSEIPLEYERGYKW